MIKDVGDAWLVPSLSNMVVAALVLLFGIIIVVFVLTKYPG